MSSESQHIKQLIDDNQTILIIQADNPDGDSLASSLALETILHELGKEPIMYCGVDIPSYLKYMPGSDRVVKDLPNNFDVSIMVDCATVTLLEQLEKTNQLGMIKRRPLIVLDHHDTESNLPFEHIAFIEADAVATGEVIYYLAEDLDWPLSQVSCEALAASILSDSMGLISEGTTARSVFALAHLVEKGVELSVLEDRRRSTMLKPKEIVAYKGELLQRIEYFIDGKLAMLSIPWYEIEKYSPLYNPSMLALEELRMTDGVKVSVALKTYPDGKITGKIRCNQGTSIADDLAGHFGGGGHAYAAGFKTSDWNHEEIKAEILKVANQLLTKS